MKMRVLFTYTSHRLQPWDGESCISMVKEYFARIPQDRYELARNADEADIILYFESSGYKDIQYARMLLQQENIRNYPEKCFVVNYDDVPIGFLPGVYVSIQQQHMDYHRFRACCYMGESNPFCARLAKERDSTPGLLFSFRGSRTAPVRSGLFNLRDRLSEPARIEETFGWYDHTPEQKESYIREILDSKFVLCPRGIGVSSHRLFETMQLGRVPVILSDDWVPPGGVNWLDCSLRVAESRIGDVPELLASREKDWREMGALARSEWEKWFAPETRVHTAIKYVEDLRNQRTTDEREFHKEWVKQSFYVPYGLHPVQRIARRIKEGRLLNLIGRKAQSVFSSSPTS